jgi:hypothetical protein
VLVKDKNTNNKAHQKKLKGQQKEGQDHRKGGGTEGSQGNIAL